MRDLPELRTPRVLSPYMLIQEFLRDDEWQLLVSVIMLNRTKAKQVWKILPDFFERFADPKSFLEARDVEIAEMIKSLGFKNRRTQTLRKMTEMYVTKEFENVDDLPGIGKYGADSHRLFHEAYLVYDVEDKELKNYLEWALEYIEETRRAHEDVKACQEETRTGHDLDEGILGDLPACALPARQEGDERIE